MADENDEQARKRYKNRIAQQKYRKRQKDHIENLEKRAARVHLPQPTLHDNVVTYTNSMPLLARGNMIDLSSLNVSAITPKSLFELDSFETDSSDTIRAGLGAGRTVSNDTLKMCQRMPETSQMNSGSLKAPSPFSDTASRNGQRAHAMQHMEAPVASLEAQTNLDSLSFGLSLSNRLVEQASAESASELAKLTPDDQPSLESRIDYILLSMQRVGFSNPESFLCHFYTGKFKHKSAVKTAQGVSRSHGIPQVLENLQAESSSWSARESGGYKEAVIKSAAHLVEEEVDRLQRKEYSCEKHLQHDLSRVTRTGDEATMRRLSLIAAELKKTLKEELPNLHILTRLLMEQESSLPRSQNMQLLLATMSLMTAPSHDSLQELEQWAHCRSKLHKQDVIETEFEEFSSVLDMSVLQDDP